MSAADDTPRKVSVAAVARAAGVSKAAAGFALANRPGVSEAKRAHILAIAAELGYVPDARIASWMAQVRNARNKDLLALAWLNTNAEEEAWRKYSFHTPYLEGARQRALELGYRLEEIWAVQPGMSMKRISNILYQRGIEGVIVSYPARHFNLDCTHLAAVSLEGSLLAPRINRVMSDVYFNVLLALKVIKRHGYRRIGVCFQMDADRISNHLISAAVRQFQATLGEENRVPPLFFGGQGEPDWHTARAAVTGWLREHRPEVIVGHNDWLVDCARAGGFQVPKELGVVHVATDDDVAHWAGINSNRRQIGAAAAEMVISHVRNRQFGVPATVLTTQVRGSWHPGETLLIPRGRL